MYEYIKGKITLNAANYLIIETSGIGYKIFADKYTLEQAAAGTDTQIYTYLKVAEDEMSLYGFLSRNQKEMFEKLLSINGVGPKAALGILSTMKPDEITAAVISGDERSFTRAPGIGKKTAQRIVMELKEKVELSSGDGFTAADLAAISGVSAVSDACDALMSLGYTRQEAARAVNGVKNLGDTAEELIGLALKKMGNEL